MRSTRITAVAAGVVILVGGLSACNGKSDDKADGSTGGSSSSGGSGAQDPSKSPLDALKAAQTATDAKKSVKLDGTTKTTNGTQTTKGGVDWSDGTQMSVEATLPGSKTGKPMKMLYTKDAVYMNMGMSIGGKPWMKYSYDALAKQSGTGSLLKEALTTANPSGPIEWMTAASDLKVVGKEDVRGVQATHYRGTITTDVQAKKLSPQAQEAIKKQLAQSKVKSETLDIWIDSNNLLVKKQEKFGATNGEVYYTGYGTKVDMTPPPASQVMEHH
ncbi:hypothetical protein [Streptomyces gilvosporeus]|uniref:hypothetical protein n=1 Tax=Streptomyces gilvosporeus TaxID=553510 RepID=UPI001F2E198D|nr:hypothetical protein [Streptomyces gilvosporeus]